MTQEQEGIILGLTQIGYSAGRIAKALKVPRDEVALVVSGKGEHRDSNVIKLLLGLYAEAKGSTKVAGEPKMTH